MRVIDCDQRSPEWMKARTGIPTASRFRDARARLKGGAWAQARLDYVAELAIERATGSLTHHFATPAMQRGTDLEDEARAAYSAETGEMVDQLGFCLHDDIDAGYSPDGLVGDDGAIEIKAPSNAAKILRAHVDGDIEEWIDQCLGGLWITGRAWCDLVVYHPSLPIRPIRLHRDEARIAAIEADVRSLIVDVEAATLALRRALRAPAAIADEAGHPAIGV